ncbi:hypothetical protein AB0F88_01100 [Streptosporangium sp. NPDC023963]|uniref:hypothetical protein n=1 Tax=Streptosporangium sp. NPDC023963 TaxID=3155608 RepID=UPI00344AC91C
MRVDGDCLVVDVPGRHPIRLPLTGGERAARLVMYRLPRESGIVHGIAILNAGGRGVLDSPGARPRHLVEAFAVHAGLLFEYRPHVSEREGYADIETRARGWRNTADVGLPVRGAHSPHEVALRLRPYDQVSGELRPCEGALEGTPCPATTLSWDGRMLVATDPVAGRSLRHMPAALYHYRYERRVLVSGKEETRFLTGLALLDADGLVLADLPGEWPAHEVAAFAAGRRLPVHDALVAPSKEVRTMLSRRAPSWTRLTGLEVPRLSRAKKTVAVCAGAAGLFAMAYVVTTGGWFAWRGLSALGGMLLDLLDAKWLAVFFSPLLVVLKPVRQAWHTWRIRRGTALGPPGGPYLSVTRGGTPGGTLRVRLGARMVPDDVEIGPDLGRAAGLMAYRHERLSGLFVVDGEGRPVRHLPGPWPLEDAHRFAARRGLGFEVRTLGREEYLDLTARAHDAVP